MSNFVKQNLFWFVLIMLLAWALRLHNLTYHSFWFDEAISVYWARQTVPRILEVGFTLQEDRLPPLYYLMLKGWSYFFGFGEIAVRTLSALFGLFLVPVITGIADLLFGKRVALLAATLVAINPFLIWYSQEARMYAPAVFFSTLAILAFLRWLHTRFYKPDLHPQQEPVILKSLFFVRFQPYFLLFLLATTAGLYSHLYTAFLLPALGLWLMLSYPRAWLLWLTFAGAGLIIALAYSPVALAIWRFSAEAMPGNPITGHFQRAWWLLQAFTVWKAFLPTWLVTVIPTATAIVALLAYINPMNVIRRPPAIRKPRLLVILLFVSPFLIATLLLFRNHLAFFGERYFIVMSPWFLLLVALGTDNLSQQLGPILSRSFNHNVRKSISSARNLTLYFVPFIRSLPFILLLTLFFLVIPGQWSAAANKEAWRQTVDYLAQHAADDHAILIHPDWVRYPFQYYFQGPGQTYAAFSNVTAATPLDGPLQGIVADHPVIWLIQSHLEAPDPYHRVEQWLADRYPLVTELYPPGITLKGYAPGYQLNALPTTATPVDLRFENGLRLVGYQVNPTASATDNLFHPPSGWIHVTLYWTANEPVVSEAAPYVHLVGPQGIWGVNLDRSADAFKFFPPSRWLAKSSAAPIIRHDIDVNLNPATPPGIYYLIVGLHDHQTQYRLTEIKIGE